VWLRPPDLPHRTVSWANLFGGSCSRLAAKHLTRSGFGRYPAFGPGSTIRLHRRSLEALPASVGRPSHRVRLHLAREPLFFGRAADGRAGIGFLCQPIAASSRFSRTLRSSLLGGVNVGGSRSNLLLSCADRGRTLRGAPAHGAALRTRLSRRDRGVHSRRNLADCHMVGANHSDPLGRGCQWAPATVGVPRGIGTVSEEPQHAIWRGNARRVSGTERCTAPREGNALKGAIPRTLRARNKARTVEGGVQGAKR
jgi:hypothetical protein